MSFRLLLLLLPAFIPACVGDRVAGTEVGNPDLAVSARFGIVGSDSGTSIPGMHLKVMGMKYRMTGNAVGMLWTDPAGTMVDMASDSMHTALPAAQADAGDWIGAELFLEAPDGDSSLPDGTAFPSFANPRYVKLIKAMGGESRRFLFELPIRMKLVLSFDGNTVGSWRKAGQAVARIDFDCGAWASVIAENPDVVRRDGDGMEYILLSPNENSGIYDDLLKLFPMCFSADSAHIL